MSNRPPTTEGNSILQAIRRRAGLVFVLVLVGIASGTFAFYYLRYARLIDRTLDNDGVARGSTIYAAPRSIVLGDSARPDEIALALHRSGYSESKNNPVGSYKLERNAIQIDPGPAAY